MKIVHKRSENLSILNNPLEPYFKMKAHTLDMSQAITEGSFETRSKENTLFFTFLARRAFPDTM